MKSSIWIMLLVLIFPVLAKAAVFGPSVNYWTANNASNNNSIAIDDFNNDNKLDMAVTTFDSNTTSIFLGTGTGSFSAATSFNTLGTSPRSISNGDFNGDAIIDLAIAYSGSNYVSVLLGVGDGTFGAPVNFTTSSRPWFMTTGDFNNDGALDLAVLGSTLGSVSLLLGVGDGTFSPAINSLAGTLSTSLAASDLNGDGNLDLVGTNSNNSISVLFGNGDGTFLAAVNYTVGSLPSSVGVIDFNADGNVDIAVANQGSDNISVLMGLGGGSFSTPVNYSTVPLNPTITGYGTSPLSLVIADFTRDGYSDLAVANYAMGWGDVSLLRGVGNGAFSTAEHYYNVGLRPQFIAMADFNGDSSMDLVTANRASGNVSVFLNQSSTSAITTPTSPVTQDTPVSASNPTASDTTSGGCIASSGGVNTLLLFMLLLATSRLRFFRKSSL